VRQPWAALLLLAVSCGGDSGSGGGGGADSSGILWNTQSATGTGGGTEPASVLWVDPNSGIGGPPAPPDPQDIRTYTRPDIYILGNRHPLLTDVTSRSAPTIIIQEDRATVLLNTFRYNEYVRLIGLPVPINSRLAEHGTLRQNARAHAKHYSVWHPNDVLPLTNAEGDSIWFTAPRAGTGIEVAPNVTRITGTATGRLWKCNMTAELVGQLIASGPRFRSGEDVATYWITTFPEFLRLGDWTHFGVGFWVGPGSSQYYYWNAVFAKNPKTRVTLPTTPVILF
jgi:hypothetical protein